MINAWHRSNKTSKELDEIPGVGLAPATALVAGVADPSFPVGARFLGRDWTRAESNTPARKSSAVSAREVIAICVACSQLARRP